MTGGGGAICRSKLAELELLLRLPEEELELLQVLELDEEDDEEELLLLMLELLQESVGLLQ